MSDQEVTTACGNRCRAHQGAGHRKSGGGMKWVRVGRCLPVKFPDSATAPLGSRAPACHATSTTLHLLRALRPGPFMTPSVLVAASELGVPALLPHPAMHSRHHRPRRPQPYTSTVLRTTHSSTPSSPPSSSFLSLHSTPIPRPMANNRTSNVTLS